MKFNINLKNTLLILFAVFALSACSTGKKANKINGDVYTETATVEYLAAGVSDRVFFVNHKSSLTTKAREALR